jgi:hypothetical protein
MSQTESNSGAWGNRHVRRIVGGLILITALRVWIGPVSLPTPAAAQIPDSGLQRKELVEAVRQTNRLLTDIKVILESRTLHVRLTSADNQAESEKAPPLAAP